MQTHAPQRRFPKLRAALLAVAGLATAYASAAPASAQTPPPPSEQALQALDPVLYEAARDFFPGDEHAHPARRAFRLTRDQIDAMVAQVLPGYATRSVKTAVPRDPLQTNYEFAELLTFNAANVRGYMEWVGEIVAKVRKDPSRVLDCKGGAAVADCVKAASLRFLKQAFRASPSDAEVVRLADAIVKRAGAAPLADAAADLVQLALTSPEFLFRKEADSTRHGRMEPAQLLQTLTFTLADAPPETLGLETHAAIQHLQTPGDRQRTLAAIMSAPQAREKLVRFFKAWLEIKEPGEFRISKTIFPEFTDQLAAAMLEETDRFLRAELAKPQPRLTDITLSTRSFLSKALAPVHGPKAATASGSKSVELDPAQRLGIFTHPAVLASHSGNTNSAPMKRGTFFSRKVMCLDLEAPPAGIDISVYEKPGATERQRIEAVTSQTNCIGCHKMIDPLGFFQGNYDALGRWRSVDSEGHPIDASMQATFLGKDTPRTETPIEALKLLTGTNQFKQCFVRQIFRFYMGRKEEPSDDRKLREMFVTFARDDTQDILALVRTLVAWDRISLRASVQTGPATP